MWQLLELLFHGIVLLGQLLNLLLFLLELLACWRIYACLLASILLALVIQAFVPGQNVKAYVVIVILWAGTSIGVIWQHAAIQTIKRRWTRR